MKLLELIKEKFLSRTEIPTLKQKEITFEFCYENYEKIELEKSLLDWLFISEVQGVNEPEYDYSDNYFWLITSTDYFYENEDKVIIMAFACDDNEFVIEKNFYVVKKEQQKDIENKLWKHFKEKYS